MTPNAKKYLDRFKELDPKSNWQQKLLEELDRLWYDLTEEEREQVEKRVRRSRGEYGLRQ